MYKPILVMMCVFLPWRDRPVEGRGRRRIRACEEKERALVQQSISAAKLPLPLPQLLPPLFPLVQPISSSTTTTTAATATATAAAPIAHNFARFPRLTGHMSPPPSEEEMPPDGVPGWKILPAPVVL